MLRSVPNYQMVDGVSSSVTKLRKQQYKCVQSNNIGPDDTLITTVEKLNDVCKQMWEKHLEKAHAASGNVIRIPCKRPAASPGDIPESPQSPAPKKKTTKKRKKKHLKTAETPVPKAKTLKKLK